jgi:hypothetical protein
MIVQHRLSRPRYRSIDLNTSFTELRITILDRGNKVIPRHAHADGIGVIVPPREYAPKVILSKIEEHEPLAMNPCPGETFTDLTSTPHLMARDTRSI